MRKLVVDPDPRLRKICADVITIDSYIKSVVKDLLDYVRHSNRAEIKMLGMAAPQLGELVRIFVIEDQALTLTAINPHVTKTSGSHKIYESCESLPGRMFITERPKVVKFKGLDLEGKLRTYKLHGMLAVAAIHEMEHLHGIMVDDVALTEIHDPDDSSGRWEPSRA